jgi:H+/Cl- antiporter ClcA
VANPLKALFMAFGLTFAVGIIAIIVALILSTSGIHDNGIATYAGGLSQRFLTLLLPGLLILFVILFFLLRRARTYSGASK